MNAILRRSPIEVVNRLHELGARREDLIEVAERMVSARNACTANHPPGSPGWMAWSEGTCRLRDIFLPLGWIRDEDHRISSIWDKKQIRMAVCNTDAGTGTELYQPQNRSKKGSGTDHAVSLNQGVLPGLLEGTLNVVQLPRTPGGIVYWYLCVYSEGSILRAELSCPTDCQNGFFTAFSERILLIGEGDSGAPVRRSLPSQNSGFQIDVTRKQAS